MPEQANEELLSLLKFCFLNGDFPKTTNSLKLTGVASLGTYFYFNFFNYLHPLKRVVLASVILGGTINSFFTFSSEIYELCKQDTKTAAKLRLHYQVASYDNIFLPYFKSETIKVAKSKSTEDHFPNNPKE